MRPKLPCFSFKQNGRIFFKLHKLNVQALKYQYTEWMNERIPIWRTCKTPLHSQNKYSGPNNSMNNSIQPDLARCSNNNQWHRQHLMKVCLAVYNTITFKHVVLVCSHKHCPQITLTPAFNLPVQLLLRHKSASLTTELLLLHTFAIVTTALVAA